jgi:hypothetical protein
MVETHDEGSRSMLIERLKKDDEEITRVGEVAIEEARAAGVPAYYIDETVGEGIVKLMPDGTIHLVDPNQDEDVVLRKVASSR